jgi:hypothetical protein
MKRFAAVSTFCALFLFSVIIPAFAQDEHHEEKKEEERKEEVRKEEHHDEHVEERRAEVRRIDDEHFRAHFGHDHHFAVRHVVIVEGRPHFAYGGYNFEIVDAWPHGWAYTDNCYIDFVDGGYFLFNLRHPGLRIAITVLP